VEPVVGVIAAEIAVAGASRLLLVGPYLAAGLSELPRAPREQGA
jgi:hypothetical protein